MEKDELLAVLNALAEPVFIVGATRQITLANSAAEDLFGKQLVGRDFVHAVRHPDALGCVEAALAGKQNAEAVIALPVPMRATYKMTSIRLDHGKDDSQTEVVVSLNDISHVLEAEQMRSDFVGNVSHELRSPLTALIGGIETLKGAAKDDTAAHERFLDIMEREAARMNRLVGDLLSLSSVEINEHVRPTGQVDVLTTIESVVTALETRSETEMKTVHLEKPDCPCLVPGDEDELTQVFQNLIENAIKYGRPDTDVQISIAQVDRTAGIQGPALAVEVRDQGEGIPPEHIPRLTERFYRVEGSRSREKGGTGLGLAIVKHILNRHRGRLVIRSEIGVGSIFTVNLPLDPAPQN